MVDEGKRTMGGAIEAILAILTGGVMIEGQLMMKGKETRKGREIERHTIGMVEETTAPEAPLLGGLHHHLVALVHYLVQANDHSLRLARSLPVLLTKRSQISLPQAFSLLLPTLFKPRMEQAPY